MSDLQALRQKNIERTRTLVRESVNPDLFILNAVNNIEDLQRIENLLVKRLREWYALYFPESEKNLPVNPEFLMHVLMGDKHKSMGEMGLKDSMGADLGKKELEEIKKLATAIEKIYQEEKHLSNYLNDTMLAHCPNLHAVAGHTIGAKLMRGAGSLKKLAMMRSSTIQLIGAEKALFRHIRTGAKPPKYGYLLQHPIVQRSKKEDRGRAARMLADKIFIAARVDYFKGKFIGDDLIKEVEVKFK